MSEAESPLTKSAETNNDQDAPASEPEESDKQAVEQDGDENEEEQSHPAQTAPNTPSSVNPPSHQSQMTPHQPVNVPIQPFYPYPYAHYGMPMHYVPHPSSSSVVYTDASTMMDPPPDARRNRGGVTEPFPEKLHRMLQVCEQEGKSDIVSFFPHGRCFAIHKPRKFQSDIMPRFFRQSRLTSFQRQLNLYGFKRISQGPDHGGYYHELFLKGRPGLCINLKRTKIKGANKQSKQDFDGEPNFYAMPPIRPAVPTPTATTSPAGAVATNGAESTANAPQASPFTNIPSPAGIPMQQFQYPPYGYAPPGSYMFPVPPNAQPYTAAQSPGPGDGQQQQQQVSHTMYPYPFFSYPPVWGAMPSSQASSPARPSAPPTPADVGDNVGDNPSPSKTETQEG